MSPAEVILNGTLKAYGIPRDMAERADYNAVASVLVLKGKREAVTLADQIAREYAHIRKDWVAA